ncbi:bilirubin utilization transcriptional regulator BilQ [uncultured Gemmiger sp.]|uniref:bilirubin utilization transcriptional regulator BilQ n=1 Tax=uncultured Gemmiger sp. TaxID=1623490 RepID=UPI0025FF9F27|nr:bilirubin utilization transcriptional regulator BilQ [uncultured Gemmiger sp.]
MYHKTLSYYSTIFHRSFAAFTGEQLQAVGLNFGLLFFVIYVGKHPGCSPAELTKALYLDWGYSQRSLNKLAKDGFLTKAKSGRSYALTLTEKGEQAFAISHQVFFTWDDARLANLTPTEKDQLLVLLQKAAEGMPDHV